MRDEVTELLRRLVACDTSNPPGREAQAAAILEDYLGAAGIECERVANDPERPNLLATLRGIGGWPSRGFLCHPRRVAAAGGRRPRPPATSTSSRPAGRTGRSSRSPASNATARSGAAARST